MLGKVFGAFLGYLMAGPVGMFFGVFIGHQFDRGVKLNLRGFTAFGMYDHHETQRVFFKTTFLVMGHVAKADGRVSEQEIQAARQIMQRMNVSEAQRQQAIVYFNQGKQADFDFNAVLTELLQACHRQRILLQMFVEIQFQVASAEGAIGPNKQQILHTICTRLGFSPLFYRRYDDMFGARQDYARARQRAYQQARPTQDPVKSSYQVLELQATATEKEVKRRYRRLMSQNHPDKLIAKGLPEEMIKLATDKTQQIQKAYETIKEARGF